MSPETPAASARPSRLKPVTLITATALSLMGSAGQFFAVESWNDIANERAAELRKIEHDVSVLREMQAQYFNSYVQSNVLFALNLQGKSSDLGLTEKLYQVSIYDRGTPLKAMMAELSNAGVFSFKETNEAYSKLADEARAGMSYSKLTELMAFERALMDKALNRQHDLQLRAIDAAEEKSVAEEMRDRRHFWLVTLSSIGTILLLLANLISDAPFWRRGPKPPTAPAAT